jgi:hypothetical protein
MVWADKRAAIVSVADEDGEFTKAFVLFINIFEDILLEVDEDGIDMAQGLLDGDFEIVSGPFGGRGYDVADATWAARQWCENEGWEVEEFREETL